MGQLHKRLGVEQVKVLLKLYEDGNLSKQETILKLEVKERQFFNLLKSYRADPDKFALGDKRSANNQISKTLEQAIHKELANEKRIINHPHMPITTYNYSAIRDAVVEKTGQKVSAQTVINKAKKWDYYIEKPKRVKVHQREVLTNACGMLLQHDASIHLWSPFATAKWVLITTLDDHSRKLLYGRFFLNESNWAHIQSTEAVVEEYGVGIAYYVDNHSIFRFINTHPSSHYNKTLQTDDVSPQWKQCVEATGMKVVYASSPQAKGKIERPYRWLQDRIVRRCAKEGIIEMEDAQIILDEEIQRYNYRQVHSTTKEIPHKRFERAVAEGRTAFKPLELKLPISSTKDIFCLREQRVVSNYGKISWKGQQLEMPAVLKAKTKVDLHIIPSEDQYEIRVWHGDEIVGVILVKE